MDTVDRGYELIHGSEALPDWSDREEVPAPPKWVREHLRLPRRYQYATLANAVADDFNPVILSVARDYVEGYCYGDVAYYGLGALLTGDSGQGKTWAAAAIVNEIVRTVGQRVTVEWLPVAWRLQELFDYQRFGRQEEYFDLRKRLFNCDILVVDDLMHASQYAPVKEFLMGLYDYRHQQRKPVITTANAIVPYVDDDFDWSALEEAFNAPFVRRIVGDCSGFIASV
jgi:DNA replication protein DnaC